MAAKFGRQILTVFLFLIAISTTSVITMIITGMNIPITQLSVFRRSFALPNAATTGANQEVMLALKDKYRIFPKKDQIALTLENRNEVRLAVDKNMKRKIAFQSQAGCSFVEVDINEDDYQNFDGIISDKLEFYFDEMRVPLHFTKTTIWEQGRVPLESGNLRATDILISHRKVKSDLLELAHPPSVLVRNTLRYGEKELKREVGNKENTVTIPIQGDLCDEKNEHWKVIREMEKRVKVIYIVECGKKKAPVNTSQVGCSLENRECFYEKSKVAFLVDFYVEANYIMDDFWIALKMGSVPIYVGGAVMTGVPVNSYVVYDAGTWQETLMKILLSHQDYVSWKRGGAIDANLLQGSRGGVSQELCTFIQYRKSHTLCLLDTLIKAEEPKDLNSLLPEEEKITKRSNWYFFDEVYVTHYTPSKARLEHMKNFLKKENINGQFIMDYDREKITQELEQCLYIYPTHPQRSLEVREQWGAHFQRGVLSLFIKHFLAFYHMIINEIPIALILEDDTMYSSAYKYDILHDSIVNIPKEFDIYMLGACLYSPHAESFPKDSYKFIQQRWPHRCTQAYAVSLKGAVRMFKSLPMRFPIDWQIWLPHIPDFRMYKMEPQLLTPMPRESFPQTPIRE